MTFWTDERCDTLRQRWLDDTPVHQIASEFGITRSAVIGKAHRMNLPPHPAAPKHDSKPAKPKKPRRPNFNIKLWRSPEPQLPQPLPSTPASDLEIPHYQRRKLMQLTVGCCRWPVGEPDAKDFFFCGAERHFPHAYCPTHCARAFVNYKRALISSASGATIRRRVISSAYEWTRGAVRRRSTRSRPGGGCGSM